MESLLALFSGLVQSHVKPIGVLGDSFTFVGSLFLAIDAIFKKKQQLRLAATRTIAADFTDAENASGERLVPADVEEAELDKSVLFARIGACLLASGFLLLLVIRLAGE